MPLSDRSFGSRLGPRRRCRDDHGAAMIEAALVSPVFILVVFAIFEFGLAYRDVLSVGDAATDAARVGAIQGPDVTAAGETADYSVVNAVRDGLAGLDPDNIEDIVIFKAGPATDGSALSQVPVACKGGFSSVASHCNSYPTNDAYAALQSGDVDYFKCIVTSDPACGWNPVDRIDGPLTADVEFLGVYVKCQHDYVTGFFGADFTIERAAIMRLEPGDLAG